MTEVKSTDWTKGSVNSTDYTKDTVNSTDFTKGSVNSTSWESSDVSAGILLFENGDIMLYEDGTDTIGQQ